MSVNESNAKHPETPFSVACVVGGAVGPVVGKVTVIKLLRYVTSYLLK